MKVSPTSSGTPVYSCGNPHEEEFLVDHGELIKGSTVLGAKEAANHPLLLFHDAMVEHGNSGGGLYDSHGHLIGINT